MAEIANTRLIISSTNQDFTLPGDWTPERIQTTYASDIPGIGAMEATVTVSGDVKTVTFRQKTGTKG